MYQIQKDFMYFYGIPLNLNSPSAGEKLKKFHIIFCFRRKITEMTTKTETNDLKSDIIHFPFALSKENNNKNTNEKKRKVRQNCKIFHDADINFSCYQSKYILSNC